MEFYWDLGKDISERYSQEASYGSSFFKKLSADLKVVIPGAAGLSPRNLRYCLDFFSLYSKLDYAPQAVARLPECSNNEEQQEKLQHLVAISIPEHPESLRPVLDIIMHVPWGHHIVIMTKCGNDVDKALFYVRKTIEKCTCT